MPSPAQTSWSFGRNRAGVSSQFLIADVALATLLIAGPLFLAGRYAIGQLVYVALASVYAFTTLLACGQARRRLVLNGGYAVLLVGMGLVAAQLAPIPGSLSGWFEQLGGRIAGETNVGTMTISLAPYETRLALCVLVAHALVFSATCARIGTSGEAHRVVRIVAIAGTILAIQAIAQYLSGSPRFVWFYEHPYRFPQTSVTGGFDNHNHFAQLMALSLGPLVVWWIGLPRPAKSNSFGDHAAARSSHLGVALPVAIGILCFAAVMTYSRGGILALAVSALTLGGLLWRQQAIGRKVLYAVAATAVVLSAALTIHGGKEILPNLSDLLSGSLARLDSAEARREIWSANIQAWKDHPLAGTGAGTHRHVVPVYLPAYRENYASHAECGYLQIASETGIAGLLLLGTTLLLGIRWCYRGLRSHQSSATRLLSAGITASLLASAVHSAWDFVWFIPATASMTLVLLACACRLSQDLGESADATQGAERTTQSAMLVPLNWALIAATLAVAVVLVNTTLGPAQAAASWDRYLKSSNAHTNGSVGEMLDDDEALSQQVLATESMIEDLRQILRYHPSDALAHLRLVGQLMRRYELGLAELPNQMPLNQIHEAVANSKFASPTDVKEWLERAFGPAAEMFSAAHGHAQQCINLCPAEGLAYAWRGEMSFVSGSSLAERLADFQRGHTLRPHDGTVLTYLGREAVREGDVEAMTRHWQAAWKTSESTRQFMVDTIAVQVGPGEFLELFQPDLEVLGDLERRFEQVGIAAHLVTIRRYYAELVLNRLRENGRDPSAPQLWFVAHQLLAELAYFDQATECGRQAAVLNPDDVYVRRTVGRYFLAREEFAEAAVHLKWCLSRRPDDSRLQRELDEAQRGRLLNATATSENAIR